MSVIKTSHLCKNFKMIKKEPGLSGSVKSLFHRKYIEKTAVSDFELSIESGEFVGLIGLNGAGKTTLIKMMTGIIAPTSGDISVLGFYPNKLENAFKCQYAVVMGQKSQLFFNYTPSDTFRLFKELYGIPEDVYKKNIRYFVDLFEVSNLMDIQVRTLSLGERMKMELIAALLHNPGVLFLDEPTIGLDAASARHMRSFLREVNSQKGTTIILTSHYMEDVCSLCPRSVVMREGRKIYDGGTDNLFSAYRTHKKITFSIATDTDFMIPKQADILEKTPYKLVFMIPKEESGPVIADMVHRYSTADIVVEEDDIGIVTERIYTAT